MKLFAQIAVFCLFSGGIFAQNPKTPSNQDLRDQLIEMQRRLKEQMEQFSPGGGGAWQWDTTLQFNIDTLFGGNGFNRQFFFSPFDGSMDVDSLQTNPFGDRNPFSDMFDLFFGREQSDENSALDDSNNDGLLPEERLRQEKESTPDKKMPSEEQLPAPEPKKPKIKTIRI